MTELEELALKYGTDKCPQIYHFYTDYYYPLFKDKKESIKKVLELGVGSPITMPRCPNYIRGGSLYMWRDFFPNAQIYGADIDPTLVFKEDRIETFLCDQSKRQSLEELIKKTGSDIDIFVDDGSHNIMDQILTCVTLMPLLKKDVIYIIEDVDKPDIVDYLREYDCHAIRKSIQKDRHDRLIVVKNKTI